MKLTFRVTFMAIILSLVVATVAVVGTSSYLNARFIARDLSSQVLDQTAARIALKIESLLGSAASITQVNRNLLQSDRLKVTDFEAVTGYFLQVIRVHSNLSFLSLSLAETGEYCDVWRKHPRGHIVMREYRRNDRNTMDRCGYVADGNGRRRTSCKTDTKYDPRRRPFYIACRKAGRLIWPDAYVFEMEEDTGIPGITCAAPLSGAGGSLVGVLTADFDVHALCKFLKEIRIGQTGFAFILEIRADGSRRVVAHPDPGILTRVVRKGGRSKRELVSAKEVDDPRVRAFVRHLPCRLSLDKLRGVKRFEFTAAGRRYLAGYQKVGGKDSPRWLIGLVVPQREIMGRVERNSMITLAIGAASFLLTLLASIWISTRVSQPLARIARETEAIGRFELDAKPIGRSVIKEVDRLMVATEDMKTGLRSFKKFVPADLVREILASGQEARLGARKATLTAFFSDIAGFTPIAERVPPDELVEHLGEYFEEMSRVIADEHGTVERFVGDGICAFWGAPRDYPDHAMAACRTALRSQQRLSELRQKWQKEGRPPFEARIGLNTGEMVVGNMGSSSRINYTINGDNVNLASRIEGLNKYFGTEIMIGENTHRAVADRVVARPLDRVSVKGKTRGVTVYELMGLKGAVAADVAQLGERYATALQAYFDQRWDEAIRAFQGILRRWPEDTPSIIMLGRCRHYLDAPPPGEWDGVHRMESK